MKKRIVYIFSYLLISIRIVVLLITECTNLSIIDLKLQYLFNILIIIALSYIVLRYRNKKKILLTLIIILTLNTMYDVFLDFLLDPTQKMYFKSPTREVVLLVEVDKEKNIYDREVNVYKQFWGILKKPVCTHEILISDFNNIEVNWENELEIELLIYDKQDRCRQIKIPYS